MKYFVIATPINGVVGAGFLYANCVTIACHNNSTTHLPDYTIATYTGQ